MVDVVLTPERATAAGRTPTRNAGLSVADTYLVRNNGRTLLLFEKTGVGACTVTVETPVKSAGLDVAERTFIVAASTGDVIAGPFPPAIYNDGKDDLRFTLSDIAGLSVAVIAV